MSLPAIPGYQSLEHLGKSAFGYSVKAIHSQNQQAYILKIFTSRSIANPQDFETANAALKTAAHRLIALDHPQIARYHRYFKLTSGPHPQRILTQAWINGSSYQTHLQRPFTEIQVHQFLQDILPVLDYLHSRHITHGDLCPSNLIFCTKIAKPVLINFSSPKGALAQTAQTPQLQTLGQRSGYSPPEQENGHAEPASDIYALGVTLLALLNGQADDDGAVHLTQPASPQINTAWFNKADPQAQPWQQGLDISPSFQSLLALMLQPNPQDRPSASELIALSKENLQSPLPNWSQAAATPYGPISNTPPPPEAPAIPLSQAATIAIGRKAIETAPSSRPSDEQYIWPIWFRPLMASEPLLKWILIYVLVPTVALLAIIGLGRQALFRLQAYFLERSRPALSAPAGQPLLPTQPSADTDSPKDCRDAILVRGETLAINSWAPVDEQFQATYPQVDTINPLNPEHRPYIQAWCDIAEDWLDSQP